MVSLGREPLVSGGIARSVEIVIGSRHDHNDEFIQGLAEGEEVVVYGHDKVHEGQPVSTYRED